MQHSETWGCANACANACAVVQHSVVPPMSPRGNTECSHNLVVPMSPDSSGMEHSREERLG
eukprot:CAMPEP_0203916214 /NCGR_PEP_ID=MMETSP0359-20131031/56899_1 /ASSEMBLY_ACC=CAM_ASM_000338 /TAXON_ID=268821 /ORGANISM="Scrippsiella Hangoei, Strain SHTV-5" /LENGTH=60 /DNA_ID=CAMNT_0050842861 /DNA_START=103 /DNA_END=282 /DNA_ORIENTATION=+